MFVIKKIILALFGLMFAFFISSCNDQGKKCCLIEKISKEKSVERQHHRRW